MDLESLRVKFEDELKSVTDAKALEDLRVKYVGRRGELTMFLRSLKDLSLEEKRNLGPLANGARQFMEEALDKKLNEFKAKAENISSIDVSRPGEKVSLGHLHPLTLIENEIKSIFAGLNFSVLEGPEVESEHYNFDSLNIPKNHPARDMWDTFWLKINQKEIQNPKPKIQNKNEGRLLMRTHTSPMQIRYMETHEPPFQIIVPGRVFRFEAIDASHEINFHQVEGLMVCQDVNLANFKFIISKFFAKLFGEEVETRFRPSYFPFVEPGLEVDIKLAGKWLEVMGAGMVHPKVFDAVKYNPKFVKGFAFGLGLERLAMIKYKIPDIRMFYENDLRFLRQF